MVLLLWAMQQKANEWHYMAGSGIISANALGLKRGRDVKPFIVRH